MEERLKRRFIKGYPGRSFGICECYPGFGDGRHRQVKSYVSANVSNKCR